MIRVLDAVYSLALGAALILAWLMYVRELQVEIELMVMTGLWSSCLLAKLHFEKRLKVARNG